jgi:hypothetical protein
MTYIVRPRMEPANRPLSLAFISAGSIQLLVNPASRSSFEQMNVCSSTRATSFGSEKAAKELGKISGFSRTNVPDSTSPSVSRVFSASEPSTHTTSAGCVSSCTSRTQASSPACVVGAEPDPTAGAPASEPVGGVSTASSRTGSPITLPFVGVLDVYRC